MSAPNLRLAVEEHGSRAVSQSAADVEEAAKKLAECSQNHAQAVALDALSRAFNGNKPAAPVAAETAVEAAGRSGSRHSESAKS